MFTITARLTFWYLIVFGAIITGRAAWQFNSFASNERSMIDKDLHDYAAFLLAPVGSRDSASIGSQFIMLNGRIWPDGSRFRGLRYLLVDKDTVAYESALQSSIEELTDSIRSAHPADRLLRTMQIDGIDYRVQAVAIAGHAGGRWLVIVGSLDRLEKRIGYLRDIILSTIPVTLLICGIGGWFLARRALAPMRELTATASAISSTNLDQRVKVGRTKDEMSVLAATFNDMISRLNQASTVQNRFVADASHDLRTPLTIIQAELELLLRRNDHAPEVRQVLERIFSESDRLSQLASDLLFLAKVDANQLNAVEEIVRLDETLAECVSKLGAVAGRRSIALRIVIDEPVEICCNPPTLERALVNVIENAIKYSPDSGVVIVRLESSEGKARVIVSDQGEGIPQEDIPRVFDRFFRSDRARTTSGSGLG
ncbi:MAG: histidine kinase dimerization/phospho-acceptor domain-containing protein, partial [Bacteroidota bacterium]